MTIAGMPRTHLALAIAAASVWSGGAFVSAQTRPAILPATTGYPAPELFDDAVYGGPIFEGDYDPAVPTLVSLLGEEVGQHVRAATPEQIVTCLKAWEASDRLKLIQHGTTWQGRPLYTAIVTSAENQANLDQIQADWKTLSDQREANEPAEGLPAVAWLGYSIHGNESSGSDASLAVLYHLLADRSEATTSLLNDVVVMIDPCLNPDGRARYLTQQRDARSNVPNVDDADNQTAGDLPGGRTNHYNFDLNRDWIYGIHPETRGRLSVLRDWHPLVMVDAHEMGTQDTFLMSPGRQPINPHIPASKVAQWDLFQKEQGEAFSDRGWRYYSGEWHEEWYPGYSSSWGSYRGAVGILYEQSRRGDIGVRRPEGFVATYRNGVHQQAESSMANLRTLQTHRGDLIDGFVEERRANVSGDGEFADRVFAVPPTGDAGRTRELVSLLHLQGFEMQVTEEATTLQTAKNRLGREADGVELPAGTVLIANRQPDAPLVSGILEFDTRFSPDVLKLERQMLLRGDGGLMYDVTSWNLPMYFDLPAYEARGEMPRGTRQLERDEVYPPVQQVGVDRRDAKVGYVVTGGDAVVSAAGRLMERDVEVKLATRDFKVGGQMFPRGSLLIFNVDNVTFGGDFVEVVHDVTTRLNLPATAIDSGTGEALPTDEPDPVDLGGGFLERLETPRIAVLTRGPGGGYAAGEVWHTIDARLGLRASYLNGYFVSRNDLRRYNVLVLPDTPGDVIAEMRPALEEWVRGGGTLISIGGSGAAALASGEKPMVRTRLLPKVLGALDAYEQAVLRQFEADRTVIDVEAIYGDGLPDEVGYPWRELPDRQKVEELQRRDEWQQTFAPRGAVLASRVDPRHWLTVGLGEDVPTLCATSTVLMADNSVDSPLRYGLIDDSPEATTRPATAPAADGKKSRGASWVELPEGSQLRLRMSGLLWPDYAGRVAHSPFVTRERIGSGQVILFADQPGFRGATLGTNRVLMNAVVFGPGCGASAPLIP